MITNDETARSCMDYRSRSVVFLFLGELFLIPHLLPIALALAQKPGAPRVTFLVITTTHEEIVRDALVHLGITNVDVRRAKGFRRIATGCRETPALPHKILLLAINARLIVQHDVAVVAERTSLWLPRFFRRGAKFIYNEHGAGPHANFASRRNRCAARILMPGVGMAARARDAGHSDAPIEVVGYIKNDYMRQLARCESPFKFRCERKTVVYVPHWLAHKSSWWSLGEQILSYFARNTKYNLVVAPHIRLPERDPEFGLKIKPYLGCDNIHIDATSFRLVNQSYINAADIYIGDGSSQVLEYAKRPRPVIFLNPDGIDWRNDPRFGHWRMGDVIQDMSALDDALVKAERDPLSYAAVQEQYVASMMGQDDGQASERAADIILDVLRC